MKKLLFIGLSLSLVLFASGATFASESEENIKSESAVEKSEVSIEERTNQLIAEGKTVTEVTQTLLSEGFAPNAVAVVLVSTKLVKSATIAKKTVDSNSDILGYKEPPGLSKDPAQSRVRNVALPSVARSKNPNAGSFASPSTF